ncbi:MAG TPA: UDP-N-acetylmuramoyl-tripeptide--D-alanyl-D-alanine ligase [Opitutaceae bacterium]|jgi:UDP-N-acetylmuramoyl-tripeptide--D-alanyl-D-alanine ligase
MPSFGPDELQAWTGGKWSGRPPAAVGGFSVDSRSLRPGQAFVALRTERRDGHDYIAAAQAAGAAAAVVTRPVDGAGLAQLVVPDPLAAMQAIAGAHRRAFTGTVFGITGSAGKTSTKEILAALLGGEAGGVLSTEANLNNQIGVALTLCRIDPARHRFAVVEAGISAPGEMRTLAAIIQPDIAIVTLVAAAHLADLGTLEAVASEKALLCAGMREGGLSVFPRSCEAYAAFRSIPEGSRLTVERVSALGDRAQPRGRAAYRVSQSASATTVEVAFGPAPAISIAARRVTDGMAGNIAMAACAAARAGVQRRELGRRLSGWGAAPLRGEWRTCEGRRVYLDCYNANPASMADALAVFRATAPEAEPRLFVIGSMEELGPSAASFHVELGRTLGMRHGDMLVAIGSHAAQVREGAVASGVDPGSIEVAQGVDEVAPRLAAFHGSIFVKGSRRYQLERAFARAGQPEEAHA